jgi:hypothetical protein
MMTYCYVNLAGTHHLFKNQVMAFRSPYEMADSPANELADCIGIQVCSSLRLYALYTPIINGTCTRLL